MNEAYLMDCMDYMKTLPDNAFDLAVVDPPYGLGIDGQKERIDYKNPKHSRKYHEKKCGTQDLKRSILTSCSE